jgi:hypothetical protein
MKKNYFFLLLTASTIGGLAFTKISNTEEISKFSKNNSHLKNGSGAPTGKSGAPGESNCTDCHSGSVQSGDGINELFLMNSNFQPVTEYVPGETYQVALSTATATKRGFQVSPRIVSSNAKAGTSVGIIGSSNVLSANSQDYITHTSLSNAAASGWAFTWTAPATDVGDVTFYYAANITNANGASSGDVIRTSQHTFSATQEVNSIEENKKNLELSVGFVKDNSSLLLNYSTLQAGSAFVNIIDMSGKSVFTKRFDNVKIGSNEEQIFLSKDLKEGVYVVNFFVNNNSISKKIMISK